METPGDGETDCAIHLIGVTLLFVSFGSVFSSNRVHFRRYAYDNDYLANDSGRAKMERDSYGPMIRDQKFDMPFPFNA